MNTTFSNVPNCATGDHDQAYPKDYPVGSFFSKTGTVEINSLGYHLLFVFCGQVVDAGDAVYKLEFTFPHAAETLELDFSAFGLQSIEDESWGIDNVSVVTGPTSQCLESLIVYDIQHLSNGELLLSWATCPNSTNQVQFSDSLMGEWQNLPNGQIIAGSGTDTLFFIDTTAKEVRNRFYRVNIKAP